MTIDLGTPPSRPLHLFAAETPLAYRFGPLVEGDRTTFRLWAPSVPSADLVLEGRGPLSMERAADGFLGVSVNDCGPGAKYKFRVGDFHFPDPASRQQADDATGWSIVREPFLPSGRQDAVRPWHEAVICEVHIGTVSPEGTFAGLMNRLEHFRDAGYTALEVMPINEFPGARNWGYDGTLIFAPESSYGRPEEFRALVDRAHGLGLIVILDVVYNHFGEVDNFVEHYAPEWLDQDVTTPWGPGVNMAHAMVRRFYYENARMWLEEYDVDGLRFDSVHEIKGKGSDQFLSELAQEARSVKRHAYLIIENMDNSFRWLERNEKNEPLTYIAQWNDDMHHVLDFLATGDGTKTGYHDLSKDPFADLQKALADGFVHDPGEAGTETDARTHGGPAATLPPDSFITYVQNHDQIGNRGDGLRLPDRTTANRLDFVHFVKFLAPQVPLCFMGDEGNLRSGFPFLVDFNEELGWAKGQRRYQEMREIFEEPDIKDGDLPEPNLPGTFQSAKLPWEAFHREEHRASLERFRELGRFRREMLWPLAATPCREARTARQGNCLVVTWEFEVGSLSMVVNPTDAPADCACLVGAHPVSTGEWSQHEDVLRLGSWSAVCWTSVD